MTNSNSANLDRFFIGLCENVFHARLGVADEPLVDYLSDLILRFVRFDQIHRVRNLAGRPAHEVADMMSEAEQRVGIAKRDVHRHIGDVTLFWTGVYPEALPRLRDVHKKDFLIDYTQQGKRAYYLASRIETDRENVERDLFRLVLTIIELVRQLMEKQALRRVDEGDLTEEQIEGLGMGLMHLERAMEDLKQRYDLTTEDLNLDLGPLGPLLRR